MTWRIKSYRHSQEFAVSEMCRNVVWLGSQGLSVPVFSLSQLVQPDVGLSCEGRVRLLSKVKLSKVKTSQLRVSMTARAGFSINPRIVSCYSLDCST